MDDNKFKVHLNNHNFNKLHCHKKYWQYCHYHVLANQMHLSNKKYETKDTSNASNWLFTKKKS